MKLSNILNNLAKTKIGTLTIASGKGTLNNESEVKQIGGWVFVHLSATGIPTGTSAIEPLATISGVPFPSKLIRGICGSGTQLYSANHTCYFSLNTSGGLNIQKATSADTAINVVVAYPVW